MARCAMRRGDVCGFGAEFELRGDVMPFLWQRRDGAGTCLHVDEHAVHQLVEFGAGKFQQLHIAAADAPNNVLTELHLRHHNNK